MIRPLAQNNTRLLIGVDDIACDGHIVRRPGNFNSDHIPIFSCAGFPFLRFANEIIDDCNVRVFPLDKNSNLIAEFDIIPFLGPRTPDSNVFTGLDTDAEFALDFSVVRNDARCDFHMFRLVSGD